MATEETVEVAQTEETVEAPAETAEAPAEEEEEALAEETATLRAAATTSNVDPVPADGQTFASDALPTAEELIANAAELKASGATISYKEAPAVGKGYAVVTVTYADGSVREVTVLVTVNDATKQELVQKSEETGTTQADAESTINGYVSYSGFGNPDNMDTQNVRFMEGVKVFAQWFEKDGAASPVYSGSTGADGAFHIVMKSFEAPDGTLRHFDADPMEGEGETWRVWSENPDPTKYDLLYQYQNGQVGPRNYVANTEGTSGFDVGPNRVNNIRIQYADAKDPKSMHNIDKAVETPNTDKSIVEGGKVQGDVFWNNYILQGVSQYGSIAYNNGNVDPAAAGITVYGSYLSYAAVAKIYAEAPAALGFEITRNRDLGWSLDNEEALQNWIKEQIAIDGKDFWIAETVSAVTDANGHYVLQFNGTYGTSWDNVGTFADANANALKGTVANAYTDGRWATSAGGSSRIGTAVSKHINKDFMFISTEKLAGVSQITDYKNNWYAPATAEYGVLTPNYTSYNDVKFALQQEQLIFDVTPYDSFDNYAAPGETATANVAGLPNAFAGNNKYAIEWTNSKGEVVVPAAPVNVSADGTIPPVPFTVPADLEGIETYYC